MNLNKIYQCKTCKGEGWYLTGNAHCPECLGTGMLLKWKDPDKRKLLEALVEFGIMMTVGPLSTASMTTQQIMSLVDYTDKVVNTVESITGLSWDEIKDLLGGNNED